LHFDTAPDFTRLLLIALSYQK
jgi:diacylglycerol kinase (ATP)